MNYPESAKELAQFNAKIADDKLAKGILVLDMSAIEEAPCDYFVIASAESEPQLKAIAYEINRRCREFDMKKPRIEGIDGGEWALLDYFDVVVHLMMKQARSFYKLEKLWADAKFYEIDDQGELKPYDISDLKNLYSEQSESE